MKYTITFDDEVKGWTSFHSYIPDWMASMNNKFYSIKDGQLWEHYDESNPVRNNFYGVQYPSTVKFVVNESPSDIKVIKALETESNKPFDVTIKSYLNDETVSVTQSTIDDLEFLNKEGKWHAHTRRNELTGDLTAASVYGLGEVQSVSVSTITMKNSFGTSGINAGDEVYDSAQTLIGVVQSYNKQTNTIVVETTPSIPADTFLYGKKPARIEGSQIRGYNFEVDLVDNSTSRTELFAVGSEVFKSFPG